MFNVIIIGGKSTNDYDFFEKKCIQCLKEKAKTETLMIRTTGDEFVEKFANKFRLNKRYFLANFKANGAEALKVRNRDLIDGTHALIAFDDGLKDTKIITDMCVKRNIPTRLIKIPQ